MLNTIRRDKFGSDQPKPSAMSNSVIVSMHNLYNEHFHAFRHHRLVVRDLASDFSSVMWFCRFMISIIASMISISVRKAHHTTRIMSIIRETSEESAVDDCAWAESAVSTTIKQWNVTDYY